VPWVVRTCALSGNRATTIANRFNGNISRLRMWNAALSDASMSYLFGTRTPAPSPNFDYMLMSSAAITAGVSSTTGATWSTTTGATFTASTGQILTSA